jgi:hypothetical protein
MRSLIIIFLAVLLGFSVTTYAGNSNNSGESGNVTAIVVCEGDETDGEPVPIQVETSSVAISADGCSCEIVDATHGYLDCNGEAPCTLCLATLQQAGLNLHQNNSYLDVDTDENEVVTIFHHHLTGNAGPFLVRLGGCPCPIP